MVSSNETFPHQVRGCTCHGVRLPVSKEALMAWLLTTYSLGSYSHDLDCCLKEFVFLFREDFQLQEYMYIYNYRATVRIKDNKVYKKRTTNSTGM